MAETDARIAAREGSARLGPAKAQCGALAGGLVEATWRRALKPSYVVRGARRACCAAFGAVVMAQNGRGSGRSVCYVRALDAFARPALGQKAHMRRSNTFL
jgi:hypothetical protein